MSKDILVSVPVITYNSSKTVIETLDSIKAQTYQNIELIISDDCSPDNTVQICREWISVNGNRFSNVIISSSDRNLGPTSNFKRAVALCGGEYIKVIAGDDILLNNAISEYVDFFLHKPDSLIAFSRVEVFGDCNMVKRFENDVFNYSFFTLPISEQYKWLVSKEIQPIPAPSSFFDAQKFKDSGVVIDESIPMLEDWPMWIQFLEKGVPLCFIDKVLVKYRVSKDSICSGTKYSKLFSQSIALLFLRYQFKPSIKILGLKRSLLRFVESKAISSECQFWIHLDKILKMTGRICNRCNCLLGTNAK